jgi:hypothetical protein
MAIPDLVAGLVYGLTGDNQLTEIEACYQGGEIMEQEIVTGINDIKKGGWDNDTQAALEFGLAVLQLPQALNTCENMGDDIAAIESWASIFTNPAELAATLSKHYILHKKEINADISAVTTEWDAQEYFKTGEAIAQLMTDAIGPIKVSESNDVPLLPNMIPDMIGGWIYAQSGDSFAPYSDQASYLAYWESCYQPDPSVNATIQEGMNLIDAGGSDNIKAGTELILSQFPAVHVGLNNCTTYTAGLDRAFSYFNYYKTLNPDVRFTMEIRNFKNNYTRCMDLLNAIYAEFPENDFFDVGANAERFMNTLVPIP